MSHRRPVMLNVPRGGSFDLPRREAGRRRCAAGREPRRAGWAAVVAAIAAVGLLAWPLSAAETPQATAAPAATQTLQASPAPAAEPTTEARSAPAAEPTAEASPAAPASEAQQAGRPRDADGSYDDYRILVDRNIFVRNRRPPRPEQSFAPRTVDDSDPAPRLVLTGTARSGEGFIAFFEDRTSGETRRAAVGKTVGGAVVQAITLDGAVILDGETTRTIQIGCDLSGREVVLPRPAETTTAAAPQHTASDSDEGEDDRSGGREPSDDNRREGSHGSPPGERPEGAPGGPPNAGKPAEPPNAEPNISEDISAILERMRQRRQEELRR